MWNAFEKKSVVKLHSFTMTSGTKLFLWAKSCLQSGAFLFFLVLVHCTLAASLLAISGINHILPRFT